MNASTLTTRRPSPFGRVAAATPRQPWRRNALAVAATLCLAAVAMPAAAATFTWTGAGTTNNWSNGSNWGGTDIANFSTLRFAGTTQLNAVNNLPDVNMLLVTTLAVDGLSFLAGAGAFNLSGNRILSTGNITNLSSSQQTLSLPVSAAVDNQTWDGGLAGMRFTGGMSLATINLTVRNNVSITNAERPFVIGDGGNATMSLQSGSSLSFASASNLTLGSGAGNTGTLNVDGNATRVNRVNALSVGYGRASLPDFGSSGTGVLSLSNQATFSSTSARIGDFNSVSLDGSGTVNLTTGASWENTTLLSVGRGIAGSLSVTGGSTVFTDDMRVGDGPFGSGHVSVSGLNSRLEVAKGFSVGHNGNGSLTAAADAVIRSATADIGFGETDTTSTGTVTLNTRSSWINDSRMTVGLGGTGTLNINAGSTVNARGGLLVGAQHSETGRGRGTVNVVGIGAILNTGSLRMGSASSALTIDSNGLVKSGNAVVGIYRDDATSQIRIENGGSWVIGSELYASKSNMELRTGGRLSSPIISLADSGDTSSMLVDGNGTIVQTRLMTLGSGGTATLTVRNGARIQGNLGGAGVLRVGDLVGSRGTVLVSDNSKLESFANVIVGSGGIGSISIGAGGTVNSTTATLGALAQGNGSVTVGSGGSFVQSSTLTVGAAGAGTLLINADGTAQSGRLVVGMAGNVTLSGGRLDYAASKNDTLATGGVFEWNSGTVNVRGSTDITRSNAFLRGATVGSMLLLSTGRALSVTDTLDIGNRLLVIDGGTVAAKTLTLAGGTVLTGSGIKLDMGADKVHGLQGFGTVTAEISGGGSGANRSRIVADGGALTLGLSSSQNGFRYDGIAEVRADSQLQLMSALPALFTDGIALSNNSRLSSFNGIVLVNAEGLSTTGAAEVQGRFTNNSRVNGGTGSLTFQNDVDGVGSFAGNVIFRARHTLGEGAQRMSFGNGGAAYGESAVLMLDLLGAAVGTFDQLFGLGTLSFNGTLNLAFGFTPDDGQQFKLFDFNQFSGSFAPERITVTGLDRQRLDFSQLATTGTLTVTPVPEPQTYLMMLAGLGLLGFLSRRRLHGWA